jgi:hypothetical protein
MNKMANKNIEFLRYVTTPLSKESIIILYAAHNVKFERCELYKDFAQSLVRLIYDTYMGDGIMTTEDRVSHFKWCWKKNKANFVKEGIHLGNKKLATYFFEFMFEHFYESTTKLENPIMGDNLVKLWGHIFDYSNTSGKTKPDVDAFLDIYDIFENSLSVE